MKTRVRKNWKAKKVQEQRDRASHCWEKMNEENKRAASLGQRKPHETKMEDAPKDGGEEMNEDVSTQQTKNQN